MTSEPRRDQTEPSSSPMAPPPTTTSFFGTESNAIAWSLETMFFPSNFRNGNSTGAEPVATTTFFAVKTCSVPSAARTATRSAARKEAAPVTTVTLRALASWATPATSLATTSSLRRRKEGRSRSTEPSLMPCSLAWCFAHTKCSLECSRALLGMQPTLRQVPPSVGRLSTRATFRPSCAARNAHT